jgi:Leucine-rich repeat (LRR) protein
LTNAELKGVIPSEILLATSLELLDLTQNKLSFLPDFDHLTLLSSLRLGTNLLVGTFPALPSGLKELDLSFNALSGIPFIDLKFSSLRIYIYRIFVKGIIPVSAPLFLQQLSVQSNRLHGTFMTKMSLLLLLLRIFVKIHCNCRRVA